MHYFLLIASSLVVNGLNGTKCQCCSIMISSDCQYSGECILNANKKCEQPTQKPNCAQFQQSQRWCDRRNGCAWTNSAICDEFTQCSDYQVKGHLCYQKDSTCIPGDQYIDFCTTGAVNCSIVNDPFICQSLRTGKSSQCWWTDKCIQQNYSKCSTITDSLFCYAQNCVYKNSACFAPICSDIKVQNNCKYVRQDDYGKFFICIWKENKCQDALDTSHLNGANCFSNTGGSYYWDNQINICSACSACSDDNEGINLVIPLSVSISVGSLLLLGIIVYLIRRRQLQQKQKNYKITGSILLYNNVEMENKQRFCTICQTNFEDNSEVVVTLCKHIFHSPCLSLWTKQNKDCPLCHLAIK